MNSIKRTLSAIAKAAAEHALKRDANCTTCIAFYQPTPPEKLMRFKWKEK